MSYDGSHAETSTEEGTGALGEGKVSSPLFCILLHVWLGGGGVIVVKTICSIIISCNYD
ncbi:hypothetical protein CWI37_0424p0010 [Hamiltosporidium tvaerminnensis]|uniref:Uncharacterized protein n=1 Tax=Hamiltosporidium tvaerminnensis TaxID=1176355 RepID=A0A4Q9L6C0_9MICR|nr:hypothetical protein CWI37_0424p0010 [Hamiltosporidium tvaerminnensis]